MEKKKSGKQICLFTGLFCLWTTKKIFLMFLHMNSNPRYISVHDISSSCKAGSPCPSLSLISAKIKQLVTAFLPFPRKMHGFLKAKGTGGHS